MHVESLRPPPLLPPAAAATAFAPKALCIDIETSVDDPFELHKVAGWRCDLGRGYSTGHPEQRNEVEARLNELAQGAAFVVGHNILQHDLPVLQRHFPGLSLHALPVIDTLLLSPLAFPQNPYHRLIKDYKLISDTRNDPLRDAQLSFTLWRDQNEAFAQLQQTAPDELACYHYLLSRDGRSGVAPVFATIRRALPPTADAVRAAILRLTAGKVCTTAMPRVLEECFAAPDLALPLAYVVAWLRVSGGNSVIPPWVRSQYSVVRELQRRLRDTGCGEPACGYCAAHLDPRQDLQRYFGFAEFRSEPRSASGGSLQAGIVEAAYAGRSLLAILPTGGGKSICYQLPGLSAHWRNGGLAVVISPLQSLMKDQVDNLIGRGVFNAATLNGLLSPPERRDVLDRLRLGDVGVVLVSPEQFRNRSFVQAIAHREISAWVFDEAHCLSKWGNDFRPDYLYVSRFIREHHGAPLAPIWCYTATARQEVIEDLRKHFRTVLGIELEVFDGDIERTNLRYEVMQVDAAGKLPLLQQLLRSTLGEDGAPGGAIVFASQRKRCEEIAGYLKDLGWACAYYHAGLEAGRKKDVQQAFIRGDLRVIVATNAFGMGVDKPDVRLVVHADIPGSLENYLQEAGRAGRDRAEARCILLYDEHDVETQFSLAARSRLSRKDIAGILRSLRRYSRRVQQAEVVVTPGEILGDDSVEIAIESDAPDADTKVHTAIAWLERARLLERNENHVRVYPGSLRVASLADAEKRLARANLSEQVRARHMTLLTELVNADADEGISTDHLTSRLGVSSAECVRMLRELTQLDILSDDVELTVLLRRGVADSSRDRSARFSAIETALLKLLPELAPDAAEHGPQRMDLRSLRERVTHDAGVECQIDELLKLVRTLARPLGDGDGTGRAYFRVRVLRREILSVTLLSPWQRIVEVAAKRRAVATVLLNALLARLPAQLRGVDLRVACKMRELTEALRGDLAVGPTLRDEARAVEAGLLYLHDCSVLIIDRGKSVFRSAMTLRLDVGAEHRQFTKADYTSLDDHYKEKNFQVHVVQEYARRGVERLSDALAFVVAYFTLARKKFIRQYFADRRETLERAATVESWTRIIDDLRHPVQQQLVTAPLDGNLLVLAGPGSGKTRVIVHRVAYLVRILREPARSVLVLAFNRAAAWSIRQRLAALIGTDAREVTVLTYHALALRLTGRSFAGLAASDAEPDFNSVLDEALALLEGRAATSHGTAEGDPAVGAEDDGLRDRLLAGYRHILVDEYQDVDEQQYRLISALAGRTQRDPDAKLTLMAVGDDDQNIYAWRKTSNEFIRRFTADYGAAPVYLIENYRSTAHIIAAANTLIAAIGDRMKADHPIEINYARKHDAPGGRWTDLDGETHGRVAILRVADHQATQAEQVMAWCRRLKALDANTDWSDFAVLARNHASLEPVRAWCELEAVPTRGLQRDSAQARLTQVREGCLVVDRLRAKPRRTLHAAALRRWMTARFRAERPDNPWVQLLEQFLVELGEGWGQQRVPAAYVINALYEYALEAERNGQAGLVLSTVHGAKGHEFAHVVILDGGEWNRCNDEERRLYYVGMTRARETLTLCAGTAHPNPFASALAGPGVVQRNAATPTHPHHGLERRYLALTQKDVDLSYAGRQQAGATVHVAMARLRYGDPIQVLPDAEGGRTLLRDGDGVTVGRLSASAQLPGGTVVAARVGALVLRTRMQSSPEYQRLCQVDAWWVVLPEIVVDPSRAFLI